MSVTLSQIAERAGVSVATVSNVLNGKTAGKFPRIAKRADNIRAIAAELGYVPNQTARHMRKGLHGRLALMIPRAVELGWQDLHDIFAVAADRGFTLECLPMESITQLANVDGGITVMGPSTDANALAPNAPVVSVGDGDLPVHIRHDSSWAANELLTVLAQVPCESLYVQPTEDPLLHAFAQRIRRQAEMLGITWLTGWPPVGDASRCCAVALGHRLHIEQPSAYVGYDAGQHPESRGGLVSYRYPLADMIKKALEDLFRSIESEHTDVHGQLVKGKWFK